MLSLTLDILLSIVIADLMTGIVHWLEDTYGNPNSKFLGIGKHVVIPNLVHHFKQRELIKGKWYDRIWTSAVFLLILLGVFFLLGLTTRVLYITFAIAVWGNEVHCWSHRTPQENGRIITFLQRYYMIQSPKQHAIHHKSPYKDYYCVMTPFLNPILEAIYFWRILEFVLRLFGIKVLRGHEVRKVDGKFY